MNTLFLRNRHLLAMSIVLLLAAALSAMVGLPRIEDPRITNRNALVLTLFPGASATRVEAQVTEKLETYLREVAEIRDIESTSRAGVSLITIELEDAVDSSSNEAAFSRIRDKLADAARELPAGVHPPEFDDKRGAVAFGVIAALAARFGAAVGEPAQSAAAVHPDRLRAFVSFTSFPWCRKQGAHYPSYNRSQLTVNR